MFDRTVFSDLSLIMYIHVIYSVLNKLEISIIIYKNCNRDKHYKNSFRSDDNINVKINQQIIVERFDFIYELH